MRAKINRGVLGTDASAQDEREVRSIVFQSGAFRIRHNVLAWEEMERWAPDHGCAYQLTTEALTRYCVWLENQSRGPAVIPALTYAVKWVCKRLAMDPPDVKAPHVSALIEKVYSDRSKELREAPPVPILAVSAVKYLVNCLILEGKISAAIYFCLVDADLVLCVTAMGQRQTRCPIVAEVHARRPAVCVADYG